MEEGLHHCGNSKYPLYSMRVSYDDTNPFLLSRKEVLGPLERNIGLKPVLTFKTDHVLPNDLDEKEI